jgi:type II secretory pathway pseudopilin PulG
MAVLVLPKISGSIKDRKESQLNNILTTIKSAAKVYYADNQDVNVIFIETLVDEDYIASGLVNPVTNEAINGCISVNKDSDGYNVYNYYDNCSTIQKVITLNLNGGTSSQILNSNYLKGDIINLTTPTKTGYSFSNWSTTCTSCLSGNTYTVGDNDDTIVANWEVL